MRNWEDLSKDEQQRFEEDFFITTDKTGLFIDEHRRPYVQTANGKDGSVRLIKINLVVTIFIRIFVV